MKVKFKRSKHQKMSSRRIHAFSVTSFIEASPEMDLGCTVLQSSPSDGVARIKLLAAIEEPIASKEPAASPPTKARVA